MQRATPRVNRWLIVLSLMPLSTHSQSIPASRVLSSADVRSTVLLSSISLVKSFPDGRVLVHDIRGRKVVVFSSQLDSMSVVADATMATNLAYSSQVGGLIPWLADSSFVVDPAASSMLVIDEKGAIARVASLPPPPVSNCFIGGLAGNPGPDARSRIVCRLAPLARAGVRGPSQRYAAPEIADSAALIRYDLSSRKSDTAAFLRTSNLRFQLTQDEGCALWITPLINPLRVVDDWTVTSDGALAIVRGADYHIDWVAADGSVSTGSRIPARPKRLSDDEKAALIDSTRTVLEKLRPVRPAPKPVAPSSRGSACDPEAPTQVNVSVRDDPVSIAAVSRGPGPLAFVASSELPDYVPPFAPASVRADLEGNVWIRTLEVVNGGSVYDVVRPDNPLVGRCVAALGSNRA